MDRIVVVEAFSVVVLPIVDVEVTVVSWVVPACAMVLVFTNDVRVVMLVTPGWVTV